MGPKGILYSVYRSLNIVRVIKSSRLRWTGHIARMEEGRSGFKILRSKSTGMIPLGTLMPRWQNNIRMDIRATWHLLDSAYVIVYWRALVNAALNLRVP